MTNELALWLSIGAGALAILFGVVSTQWILKQPAGTDRMQEIAAAVQEGAAGRRIVALVFNLVGDGEMNAARVPEALYFESEMIDAAAPILFNPNGTVAHNSVEVLDALRGADRMVKLDDASVVIVRDNNLETIALP